MSILLGNCSPFKISKVIVCNITIKMIDRRLVLRIRYKMRCYQTMNKYFLNNHTFPEPNTEVSTMIYWWYENPF